MSVAPVLIIGYGNPGRFDDGLGPCLARRLEELKIEGVEVDTDYQLTLEYAFDISNRETVIFADAETAGREPFSFRKCFPVPMSGIGSHDVSPGVLLFLAREMFGSRVKGYILGIRGYRFDEFGEGLSENASRNLECAVQFLSSLLSAGAREAALETASLEVQDKEMRR